MGKYDYDSPGFPAISPASPFFAPYEADYFSSQIAARKSKEIADAAALQRDLQDIFQENPDISLDEALPDIQKAYARKGRVQDLYNLEAIEDRQKLLEKQLEDKDLDIARQLGPEAGFEYLSSQGYQDRFNSPEDVAILAKPTYITKGGITKEYRPGLSPKIVDVQELPKKEYTEKPKKLAKPSLKQMVDAATGEIVQIQTNPEYEGTFGGAIDFNTAREMQLRDLTEIEKALGKISPSSRNVPSPIPSPQKKESSPKVLSEEEFIKKYLELKRK